MGASACRTTAGGVASCQAKVADLEFAVGIDEKVTRLEVAVKNVGGVDVFETTESLINEGLEMSIGKGLLGSNVR